MTHSKGFRIDMIKINEMRIFWKIFFRKMEIEIYEKVRFSVGNLPNSQRNKTFPEKSIFTIICHASRLKTVPKIQYLIY